MKFRFLLILLMASCAGCVRAQSAISLRQAIESAWANRNNIQAGRWDVTIRKLQTQALYKKYWPQLSIEYNYLYNPILQTSILPIGVFNPTYPIDATKSIQFGTKWSQTAGITLNQPLIDVSTRRSIREYELQEKITAATQAQTEYDLAYTVAQAYINIMLQEKKILSAVADTGRTWVSYQLQKDQYDAKRLLKSDLNKARINHNNTLQKWKDAVSELVENKVYLLYLTGQKKTNGVDIEIDTAFFSDERWRDAGLLMTDSIPEILQLGFQSRLPLLQTSSEKAKYLPSLSIKGYLGANQYTNNFNPFESNSWFGLSYIGLDFKLPLLFGEDRQSRIRQLLLQGDQFEKQKLEKADQYAKDAITAKIKIDRVRAQLATLEENITLSQETIKIVQDRVKEGQEKASTLNAEELELQSTQSQFEIDKSQLWLNWLDLLKASGRLQTLWR